MTHDEEQHQDDGRLTEEAERLTIEKLQPIVDRLEETLDLKYHEGAPKLLLEALISAMLHGVRLGSVHQVAELQKQGIEVHLHDHLIMPDEPEDS